MGRRRTLLAAAGRGFDNVAEESAGAGGGGELRAGKDRFERRPDDGIGRRHAFRLRARRPVWTTSAMWMAIAMASPTR